MILLAVNAPEGFKTLRMLPLATFIASSSGEHVMSVPIYSHETMRRCGLASAALAVVCFPFAPFYTLYTLCVRGNEAVKNENSAR